MRPHAVAVACSGPASASHGLPGCALDGGSTGRGHLGTILFKVHVGLESSKPEPSPLFPESPSTRQRRQKAGKERAPWKRDQGRVDARHGTFMFMLIRLSAFCSSWVRRGF